MNWWNFLNLTSSEIFWQLWFEGNYSKDNLCQSWLMFYSLTWLKNKLHFNCSFLNLISNRLYNWCLFEKASQLCITKPNFIIYEPLLTFMSWSNKDNSSSTSNKLSEWYKPENPYMINHLMDLEWLQNYKLMIFIKVNLTKCCDCLVVISSSGTNKKLY